MLPGSLFPDRGTCSQKHSISMKRPRRSLCFSVRSYSSLHNRNAPAAWLHGLYLSTMWKSIRKHFKLPGNPRKKSPTKKSPTNKSPTNKSPTNESPTNKSPTNKSPMNKSPTKKSTTKKSTTKRSLMKRFPMKKSPTKKSLTKKSPTKSPQIQEKKQPLQDPHTWTSERRKDHSSRTTNKQPCRCGCSDPEGTTYPAGPQGRRSTGIHSIEDEITYASNPDFVFHDSGGFEAGGVEAVEAVWEFIRDRSLASPSRQLHAIWLCIPTDNDRPFGFLGSGFFSKPTASVPVIGIFTKLDGREMKVMSEVVGPIQPI
ncbi:hypothetical protein BS47DRAFT_177126 [Hydnum rufescens UP504]|uniref:Uncharacterized protein n=1 Tax=Hydnum rufescens UP504 TaxID=1448309 RepID=A0A9P6APR3_9AGAM|nr:hypothetical protein BS47DRAFT_177126 [Hydnum rufescens UP504]